MFSYSATVVSPFGSLKQSVRRLLGLRPPPAPRPEPYVLLEFSGEIHGPRPAIEAAVEEMRRAVAGLGGADRSFKADYRRSRYAPTRPTPGLSDEENARLEAAQREREERASRPLPEAGRRLFDVLRDLGDALKAEDPAAFGHAERFAALLREHPDIVRLLRQNEELRSSRNARFEASSDGRLRRRIEDDLARIGRSGDLEALCEFFFEPGCDGRGVFRELLERLSDIGVGRRGHALWDEAFERVLGTPESAHEHFLAFMRGGHETRPRRVREEQARRDEEFSRRLTEITRLQRAEGGDAPEDGERGAPAP